MSPSRHRMISILLVAFAVIGGWYAFEGGWDRRLFRAEPGKVCVNLSAAQAKAWLRDHPETQVLDLRTTGEFAGGALPSAIHISLGDESFDSKVALLDKERPVLVYCAGGFRSRKAVGRLKQLGFHNIQHIHRGYMSWKPDPKL